MGYNFNREVDWQKAYGEAQAYEARDAEAPRRKALEINHGLTPPPRQIFTDVELIRGRTEKTHELLNQLIAQLAPVLRPAAPRSDASEKRAAGSCALSETLLQHADNLDALVFNLNDLLDRLEV